MSILNVLTVIGEEAVEVELAAELVAQLVGLDEHRVVCHRVS